jgi:hypothetical protein
LGFSWVAVSAVYYGEHDSCSAGPFAGDGFALRMLSEATTFPFYRFPNSARIDYPARRE